MKLERTLDTRRSLPLISASAPVPETDSDSDSDSDSETDLILLIVFPPLPVIMILPYCEDGGGGLSSGTPAHHVGRGWLEGQGQAELRARVELQL